MMVHMKVSEMVCIMVHVMVCCCVCVVLFADFENFSVIKSVVCEINNRKVTVVNQSLTFS